MKFFTELSSLDAGKNFGSSLSRAEPGLTHH
jgi:hypothetical protein